MKTIYNNLILLIVSCILIISCGTSHHLEDNKKTHNNFVLADSLKIKQEKSNFSNGIARDYTDIYDNYGFSHELENADYLFFCSGYAWWIVKKEDAIYKIFFNYSYTQPEGFNAFYIDDGNLFNRCFSMTEDDFKAKYYNLTYDFMYFYFSLYRNGNMVGECVSTWYDENKNRIFPLGDILTLMTLIHSKYN